MTKISTHSIELIDAFCAKVVASKRKLIFWDTCALLDIIRFPRDNNYTTLPDLIKIHADIVSDRIYSVASEISITEYNNHEEKTIIETKELIKKNSIQYNSIVQISNHFTSANLSYVHIDTATFNIEKYLIRIVDEIIGKTFFIQKDEIAKMWLDRIVTNKTPVKRKGEYKDAAIWSTCIYIADKVNALSPPGDMIFFSSNINDYYDAAPKTLSRDIQTECSSFDITFTTNFSSTAASL